VIPVTFFAGTGTFGRVRLVKGLSDNKYSALKILKKSEVIRLKQVEHIKSEISLLKVIQHPFVVNL
jgi:serine/threonine protein kinase